jgi:hypothetical protein
MKVNGMNMPPVQRVSQVWGKKKGSKFARTVEEEYRDSPERECWLLEGPDKCHDLNGSLRRLEATCQSEGCED